jgi:hypothetical protein
MAVWQAIHVESLTHSAKSPLTIQVQRAFCWGQFSVTQCRLFFHFLAQAQGAHVGPQLFDVG